MALGVRERCCAYVCRYQALVYVNAATGCAVLFESIHTLAVCMAAETSFHTKLIVCQAARWLAACIGAIALDVGMFVKIACEQIHAPRHGRCAGIFAHGKTDIDFDCV